MATTLTNISLEDIARSAASSHAHYVLDFDTLALFLPFASLLISLL